MADFFIDDTELDAEGENNEFYDADVVNTVRNSDDKLPVYKRGWKLLEICVESRMRILNGRCISDYFGSLTCHQPNGSSVVDYLITNENNIVSFRYYNVLEYNGAVSDHCCVSLALKCNYFPIHSAMQMYKNSQSM